MLMNNRPMNEASNTVSLETDQSVKAVMRKAHEELCKLRQQRTVVTRRIGAVKQTIAALVRLFGDGALNEELRAVEPGSHRRATGITDTCRRVLMEADRPLSASAVRDLIQKSAPAVLAHHKDPLVTVTTVLSRLAGYGEAHTVLSDRGQRTWQWSVESELNLENDLRIDRNAAPREAAQAQKTVNG